MLIALAFAHFSSELLLKEQMIIPVKKTLNNAGHSDAKIDHSLISRANCCWKSKWLSLLKKALNNAGHMDAKLIDFSEICQKNPAKSAVFYWLILGEVSPRNFRWNRPIFVIICLRISFKIWLFSTKIPRNRPIFQRILTFFPAKIPRNQSIFQQICPWKSPEILLFFPRNIRGPVFDIDLCH